MKKNNMGKLLGVALVVAIICTGLFYMMFAMKANSQTGTTDGGGGQSVKGRHGAEGRGSQDHRTGRFHSFPRAPIATRRKSSEIRYSTPWRQDEPVLNARLATSQSGGGVGRSRGHARGVGSFDRFDRRSGPAARRTEASTYKWWSAAAPNPKKPKCARRSKI